MKSHTQTGSKRQKRRFGAVIFGLLSALGLGVAVGTNMQRLVDLDQSAAWLQQAANLVQSGFEAARYEVGSRIASFTTKPVSAAPAGPTTEEIIGQAVTDLNLRMDQVRAGNELSARDLGQGIERIRNAVEENHRETVAKLVQLAERVERVERQAAAVPAETPTHPVVQQTASSPPPEPAAKPVAKTVPEPAPKTKAKAAPKQTSREMKLGMDVRGIANWTVRNALDGKAILQGPRGSIKVGVGDTIPEIGRVQAIMRLGSRWVVATTKGVITPQ